MTLRVLLALAALGWFAIAGSARAEMRAIIMGFDTYASKQALAGSRADALDLSQTLAKRGVTDLTVVGERATRADFTALWSAMLQRAKPGDVLFLSFSGHGNLSPEKRDEKHTPDGIEKGFLLPAYDEAKRPDEILRDNDLYDLFKVASDRGLKTIFVADACHAGAAIRSVSSSPQTPRFQRFETFGAPLPPPPDPARIVRRAPIPNVTIYSAADERQQIQEFSLVEGQKRGVLSYAVARGLEGKAATPTGTVTAGSLADYVLRNVTVLSNNTQIPAAQVPDRDLSLSGGVAAKCVPLLTAAPLGKLTLAAQSESLPPVTGVTLSTDRTSLNLAWNAKGEVRNATGDIVAFDVMPERLQDAIDARRVLDALVKTVEGQCSAVGTTIAALRQPASDRYYTPRDRVQVSTGASALSYLTVVDLTADGTVQSLYPRDGDPVEWPRERSWSSPPFAVVPPFGQDTVVFIRSDRPLRDLHAALARLHDTRNPLGLYEALRTSLAGAQFALGLQSFFTCSSLGEDGACAASDGSR